MGHLTTHVSTRPTHPGGGCRPDRCTATVGERYALIGDAVPTPTAAATHRSSRARGHRRPLPPVFRAGDYSPQVRHGDAGPPFVDEVVVDFRRRRRVGHYHVPLLVSRGRGRPYRVRSQAAARLAHEAYASIGSTAGALVHLITGIAGSAPRSISWRTTPAGAERRAGRGAGGRGELWAVHGGGFYHVQKYRVAPAELPSPLHWFKWRPTRRGRRRRAVRVMYYANARAYMMTPRSPTSPRGRRDDLARAARRRVGVL